MFRGLPRHDGYAANNSPWLGELPAHWTTERTKSLLIERVEKGYPDEALLAATQSHGVIRKSDYGTRTVTASKDLHLLKLVDIGDFVISLRSFQGGIERCYHRGIISPAYTVLTARSAVYRDYLTFLFKSKPFISSLTLAVTGIREGQNIDYSMLAVDLLPVPPVEEQAAIVKYLTHANARIDKAIAAKRRLIALLREQRVQRRHELILKGLEPSVRFRESGIKWIGDFPEHWKIVRVKQLTQNLDSRRIPLDTVERGKMSSRIYDYYGASGVIDKVEDYIFDETLVLLAEDGANLVLRNLPLVLRVDGKFWVNNHAHVLRVVSADVDYLVQRLELLDYRPWITGAAQPKLTGDRLMSIPISMPPLDEQRSIMEQLSTEFAEIDTARERLSAEIELLQEFRTRLVADVVTGQVDVRAIAATLPDAPESFDNTVSATDDDLEEALSEGEE
ncbi:restriction endonuclease subunit S [Plantibacter sp. CFBP 13570]|uniref:restriction endonuclease subunit S n=1 Tax=Plantibacter sp. CFBP 13570 TaxID=2775272 RepID=UPI0019309782|nr:restriction endonuclease subunit S [Plantibacter sp. CFBP 13570]MBD8535706.1 restriction endonuclease subunit S [Plantibacter sp. CFBP 13570]